MQKIPGFPIRVEYIRPDPYKNDIERMRCQNASMEVATWVRENISDYRSGLNGNNLVFHFKNAQDAIRLKLAYHTNYCN